MSTAESELERMLIDETIEPRALPLSLLEKITHSFSDDLVIGKGGFAVVYKGILDNGAVIAVKKLHRTFVSDKKFQGEVGCLMKVKHKNIVRFLGYCADTTGSLEMFEGHLVMAVTEERLMCFEYLPKGSLERYIKDTSGGLEWRKWYKIIKGICEGLNYLHKNYILHLDLKPSNILMDEDMMPKIIDFGGSRCFEEYQTHDTATQIIGTMGYVAPELFLGHQITYKSDLFSLGVIIIEILTGEKGSQVAENILRSWMNRSDVSQWEQIRVCTEIGIECTDFNPAKRPDSINHIVDRLLETESSQVTQTHGSSELLVVHQFAHGQREMIGSSKMVSKPHYISFEHTGAKPLRMTLQHLKDITNNFCNERIIGKGGWSVVYKGVIQKTGTHVAVKKLVHATPSSQKQFENEIYLLMKLDHPNIVRLLGYCNETRHLHMPHEGKSVFVLETESMLCFEYLPNGSLDKHISDPSSGLDWHTRCKIIQGISFGLHYLHEEADGPILHLDLKPGNILLAENMLPKIADFGLSRLLDKSQTIHTAATSGTLGYLPPEYFRGIITPMFDIFSFGVTILEVITGQRDYPYDITESSEAFIELELQKWRNTLQRDQEYKMLEKTCQQIKRCIQIGLICVNPERHKRPTIKEIVDMIQGLKSMNWYITNVLSSHGNQEQP